MQHLIASPLDLKQLRKLLKLFAAGGVATRLGAQCRRKVAVVLFYSGRLERQSYARLSDSAKAVCAGSVSPLTQRLERRNLIWVMDADDIAEALGVSL